MSAEAEACHCYESELDRDIRRFAAETKREDLAADARELASRLLCGEISVVGAEYALSELEERKEALS